MFLGIVLEKYRLKQVHTIKIILHMYIVKDILIRRQKRHFLVKLLLELMLKISYKIGI